MPVADLVQLSVYVAEPHAGGRRSAVHELLSRARAHGSSGGTVLAACGGFGRRHVHEPTFWHRADETPLLVVFVDEAGVIDRVQADLADLFPDAFATARRVRAIRYGSGTPRRRP